MMDFLVNVAAIIIGRIVSHLLMAALLSTEIGQKWYAKFGMKTGKKMVELMNEGEAN